MNTKIGSVEPRDKWFYENLPPGKEAYLDRLVDKHIDLHNISRREFKRQVNGLKVVITMGLI